MLHRCHIKKDDKVKVIAGKDKGKISKVLKVIDKKNKVLVERVNLMKRHTRPNVKNRQGGIVEGEAAIHWSNVMLICSSCMTPIRVKIKQLDDGKNVRMCRKCQEIIDR